MSLINVGQESRAQTSTIKRVADAFFSRQNNNNDVINDEAEIVDDEVYDTNLQQVQLKWRTNFFVPFSCNSLFIVVPVSYDKELQNGRKKLFSHYSLCMF